MTAQSAINLAETSNVNLFITSSGKIRYEGDQHSVEQLLPLIKKYKAEIIRLLNAPDRQGLTPVEPNLKPCPLCNGREFMHGNQGGYFCIICQPDARLGTPIRVGGERPVVGNHLPEQQTLHANQIMEK